MSRTAASAVCTKRVGAPGLADHATPVPGGTRRRHRQYHQQQPQQQRRQPPRCGSGGRRHLGPEGAAGRGVGAARPPHVRQDPGRRHRAGRCRRPRRGPHHGAGVPQVRARPGERGPVRHQPTTPQVQLMGES